MPSYHRSLACPHQMTFSSTFLIGNFVVKYTLMIFLRIDCKVVMKFITHSFQTTESPWLTRIPRHRHRSLFSIVINMSLLRSLQRRWSSAVRQPKAFAKSSYEAARLLNHSWQKGETWWSFCNKFSSTADTNSNWQRCYYSELLPDLSFDFRSHYRMYFVLILTPVPPLPNEHDAELTTTRLAKTWDSQPRCNYRKYFFSWSP